MRLHTLSLIIVHATVPLLTSGPADGQAQRASRWEVAGVPALNYDSDEGLGYGASVELYNYGPNPGEPYRMTVQPDVFFTSEGRRDLTLFLDAPGLLPSGWRLDAYLGSERHIAAPYYGPGNNAIFDADLETEANPYFYRFGRERHAARLNLQRQIGASPLRILIGAGVTRTTIDPTPRDEGTTLLAQTLAALEEGERQTGGWSNSLRAGMVWDTRDREIGPTRGTWSDVIVQRVHPALGSDWSYTRITATDRRYFPVTGRLTFAQRMLLQSVQGDAPFFDLYTIQSSYKPQEGLGGAKTLRGIPKNRYTGEGVVLSNSELRWRAADFRAFSRPMHLVTSVFSDAGRVWDGDIALREVGTDLHWGVGGGVRLGVGENFVVAVDVGHSPEAVAPFYIGLRYLY